MASIAPEAGERTVSIGRVFSRAFGTIGSNPVATLGIAFLFGALPYFLLIYLMATVGNEAIGYLGLAATVAVTIGSAVIAVLLSMITQGALVRATVAHERRTQGEPCRLRDGRSRRRRCRCSCSGF